MATMPLAPGYEMRTQEFPQPPNAVQTPEPPADLTQWVNDHPEGAEVPGGTVYKVFPPIWLGVIGSGNPVWIAAYIAVLRHGV